MADGVQITAGAGTTILTDDTGAGGHAQIVKLGISTDGSATLIPADATNGIDVDVTRVSGNVTVVQGTASNLNAQVVGAGAAGAAVSGNPVLNAGSDGTNARTLKTDTAGNQIVVGDVANDSADSGNPVKVGGVAEATPSTSTMITDGDRANLQMDIDNMVMVKPYTSYGDILVERVSNTDGASTASTVFGATAGARNMITTIAVYNSSTTNGFVDIRDGTGGTVLFTIPLPANGGAITNFPVPLRQTTANTALAYDVSAALTTVYISFIGFKSKV